MPFIQLQFRRGTAAQWTSVNPTLAGGEMGIETDTNKFKIGDDTTPWNLLPYGGLEGPAGKQGTSSSYNSSFKSAFTTPNENDSIFITDPGLKDLSFTPGESAIITTSLKDTVTYYSGSSTYAGNITYTTGNASSQNFDPTFLNFGSSFMISDPIYYSGKSDTEYGLYYSSGNAFTSSGPILWLGNAVGSDLFINSGNSGTTSGIYYNTGGPFANNYQVYSGGTPTSTSSNIYYGGTPTSYFTSIVYNSGNAIQAPGTSYNSGNAFIKELSYNAGKSNTILTNLLYYAGNAVQALGNLLSGGNSDYRNYIYFGGSANTVSSLIYYGGNSNFINGISLVNAGTSIIKDNTSQNYIFSAGSTNNDNSVVYSSGGANNVFGQVISSGVANTVYNNLETQLEGIVKYYNKNTGQLALYELTNIRGLFGGNVDYNINLTGSRGVSITSNYGPPIQQIGRNGDTYIDRLSKNFYIKQGQWNLL